MRVDCSYCGRSFDIDERRTGQRAALQCVCGHRLPLRHEVGTPTRLGKYELKNRIAAGGMGEIYYGKVTGVEGFEKEVAIKKMLPNLSADRGFIDMLVKEAKLTVLLNHPNIVGVYDLAKQGQEYYIAMEYVPGITVGAILEQAREAAIQLPYEVAIHITLQILRGLAYAHHLPLPSGERLTILHRDITPQNILVTRHAFVKITDFGIAKALNESSTTSPGMIKGKLGYIAPEQLEGVEPDQRVDLFCAGILLWEMCALRRLFKGQTEADTFRIIAECKIPSLATLRDDIPQALEAVIMRALARDPKVRYARAEEFAAALNQAIAPRTADDVAEMTDVFFTQHPEFFNAVDAHKGGDAADVTRSVTLSKTTPSTPERLDPVSRFLDNPFAQTLPRWPFFAAGGAGVVALLAAGMWATTLRPVSPPNTPPVVKQPATALHSMAPESPAPAAPPVAAEAPRPAPQKPAPKDPRRDKSAATVPLSRAEINATLQKSYPSILRCIHQVDADQAPPRLDATIRIEDSGRVASLDLNPQLDAPNAAKCVSDVLKKIQFRRHPDGELTVTFPIMIRKLQQP